jgi:hypothetical protein
MTLDHTSDLSSWTIDLRDGFIQIQRIFKFADSMALNCFVLEAERSVKNSAIAVSVDLIDGIEPNAIVVMRIIPVCHCLEAARSVAKRCEDFSERVVQFCQSAA